MSETDFDVVISGAGSIGLVSALLLAKHKFKVALIDPKPLDAICKVDDTRNIALMQSSLNVLKYLGVFDQFLELSRPLRELRIVDATNRLIRAPEVLFKAADLDLEYFALNIPMGAILTTLCAELENYDHIKCLFGQQILHCDHLPNQLNLTLSNKSEITTKTLIGSDGRNSIARKFANIETQTKSYPQMALGFAFKHSRDLGDVSIEFHRQNGPFTLIPMRDNNGAHQTSLVWSEAVEDAMRIKGLAKPDIATMIQQITHGIVGEVLEIGYIAAFPLANIDCNRYADKRIILAGEAAHILPPIGAQGMNLGFQDAAVIDEILFEAANLGQDIGGNDIMRRYNDSRKLDIHTRAKATDLLNTSLMSSLLPMQFARGFGLFMLERSDFIKSNIMRKALHPLGKTPISMRE